MEIVITEKLVEVICYTKECEIPLDIEITEHGLINHPEEVDPPEVRIKYNDTDGDLTLKFIQVNETNFVEIDQALDGIRCVLDYNYVRAGYVKGDKKEVEKLVKIIETKVYDIIDTLGIRT